MSEDLRQRLLIFLRVEIFDGLGDFAFQTLLQFRLSKD